MVIWKQISSFEGHYEVSNEGSVRSLDRYVNCKSGVKLKKGVMLKPGKHKDGYLYVTLYLDGKSFYKTIHRLVAQAFIENDDLNKSEVNHKDGVKHNNNFINLEWVTPSENMKHAYKFDRRYRNKPKGSNSSSYKGEIYVYKDSVLVDILEGATDMVNKGYDSSNVSKCLKDSSRTHRGCKFFRYIQR